MKKTIHYLLLLFACLCASCLCNKKAKPEPEKVYIYSTPVYKEVDKPKVQTTPSENAVDCDGSYNLCSCDLESVSIPLLTDIRNKYTSASNSPGTQSSIKASVFSGASNSYDGWEKSCKGGSCDHVLASTTIQWFKFVVEIYASIDREYYASIYSMAHVYCEHGCHSKSKEIYSIAAQLYQNYPKIMSKFNSLSSQCK